MSSVKKIKDNSGNVTSDPVQMSNIFNDYFVNAAGNITAKIPKTFKSPLAYMSDRNPGSIFLSPITNYEVNGLIAALNPAKSVGPNSIPIKLLKILGLSLSPFLTDIINQSFQTGVFPEKLKIAKVITIFKKGDYHQTSNYRPISLLSIFSKIFERAMYKRLFKFLQHHKILYNLQFGFQEHHSIDHALISLTETIRKSLDNKRFGCGIFIELQKAFDTVNHQILLSKMEHYGVRGCALDWFKSYLSDRKQYVSINGSNSGLLKIFCGVPQGSVLGPLLFLLYINDLPNVSKRLKLFLFADDTIIYYESDNLNKLVKTVNTELRSVKKWLDANKLSLNVEKTKFMIFRSVNNRIDENPIIKIGKKTIQRAKFVKFLELLLDENLSWKFHLKELSKKLARTCCVISKVKSLLSPDVLLCLYNSFFMSFAQYGIIVWGNTLASYTNPVYKLQKKLVRIISSQPASLELLRITDVFQLKLLTFVFETVNRISPRCFDDFFLLNSSVHEYNTRQASKGDLFLAQKNTLQYGLNSIRYKGAKLWNEIPVELRSSYSKASFKIKVKMYFLCHNYTL